MEIFRAVKLWNTSVLDTGHTHLPKPTGVCTGKVNPKVTYGL